jgi:hypothetical protein
MSDLTDSGNGPSAASDPWPVSTAISLVLEWSAAVADVHARGSLHGNLIQRTVRMAADAPLPDTHATCLLGSGKRREATPLPLRGLGPLDLSRDIAAAAQQLGTLGVRLDPRVIDVYQLAAVLCRLLTGEPADAYLRSPRARASLPDELCAVLERALIVDRADAFVDITEFRDSLLHVRHDLT